MDCLVNYTITIRNLILGVGIGPIPAPLFDLSKIDYRFLGNSYSILALFSLKQLGVFAVTLLIPLCFFGEACLQFLF